MRNKNIIQFSVDLKALVRCALNDPECRQEIIEALKAGPIEPTAELGIANVSERGESNTWFSLFFRTSRKAEPGEKGFLFRSKQPGRVVAFLKRQIDQRQEAQSIGDVLPQRFHKKVVDAFVESLKQPEVAKALVELSNSKDE